MPPPDAIERAQFHAHLRRIAPVPDADLALVDDVLAIKVLRAGEWLLAAGDRAVECGALLSGLLREYYPLADGREVTRGFAGPGDAVGSLSDLLTGQPSASAVIAERDARLVVLPWARLRALADETAAWSRFLAAITERLYLTKAAREYELLALDAEARYARFRVRYATLEDTIPLRLVASYIGVTPEHLSRLRRRANERAE